MQTTVVRKGCLCRTCETRFIPANGTRGEKYCSVECSFWSGVRIDDIKPNSCWPWQKKIRRGRAIMTFRNERYFANRASYFVHHKEQPGKMRNLCGTASCVNPNHWSA